MSLAPHLLEEPYEGLEALESGDEQAFCEELGDVLLQVVFHARVAAERDDGTTFTIDDVADGIVAKLVRRHPHVFGDVTVSGADEVKRNWDEIKREEKGKGVPSELARLDGDPEPTGPAGPGGEIGRELFRLVMKAREAGLDPEMELRAASATSCAPGKHPDVPNSFSIDPASGPSCPLGQVTAARQASWPRRRHGTCPPTPAPVGSISVAIWVFVRFSRCFRLFEMYVGHTFALRVSL